MEYAFTVKYLGKENVKKVPSDYDPIWAHWAKQECNVIEKEFEPDSLGACHCHGIVAIPKNLFRRNLCITGVHMKLDPITDKAGWLRYMRKNQCKDKFRIVNTRSCLAQRPERSERPVREDPRISQFIANPMSYKKPVSNLQGYRNSVSAKDKLFSLLILY